METSSTNSGFGTLRKVSVEWRDSDVGAIEDSGVICGCGAGMFFYVAPNPESNKLYRLDTYHAGSHVCSVDFTIGQMMFPAHAAKEMTEKINRKLWYLKKWMNPLCLDTWAQTLGVLTKMANG